MPSNASFSTNGFVGTGVGVEGLALLFRDTLDNFSDNLRIEEVDDDSLLRVVEVPFESWDREVYEVS
jgi:hypothetical protein